MPTNILMPALSPTMEKGNLAKWLKKEGDTVKSGDVIAEIETDKATMEFEAVDEGVLGQDRGAGRHAGRGGQRAHRRAGGRGRGRESGRRGAPKSRAGAERRRSRRRRHTGAARRTDAAASRSARSPPPARRAPRRRRVSAARAAAGARRRPRRNRIFSSPLARRLAKEAEHRSRPRAGLRSAWPRRSRATSTAAKSGKGLRAPACRAAPAGAPRRRSRRRCRTQQIRALYEDGSYEFVPHDGMRQTIAQRLTASKQTIPHFYLTHRLRHRQASGRARGDQRRRAEGQGRQAGLQAFGQRLRHQGAGAGAAARARRQCDLDRSRHAQAQAFRRRRRGGAARRPDHADHPQRRDANRCRRSPTR